MPWRNHGIQHNSSAPVKRWVLTSHTISQCQLHLEEEFLNNAKPSRPKDLGPSRMKFDQTCIDKAIETINTWGNPFKNRDSLVHLCSGVQATYDVSNDLINAESIGSKVIQHFLDNRFKSNKKSLYAPITKNKLNTFKDMAVKVIVKSKENSATIAAEQSLFGRLLILAKSRESFSLDEVLKFSLSPIPWSLGQPDAGLVKTNKSKLISNNSAILRTIVLLII